MSDLPLFTTYPSQAGVQYKYTTDPVPAVQVPASLTRAERLRQSGAWTQWGKVILTILERRGVEGATWQELGRTLNLHHGQISGRLSTLHDMGEIFSLAKTRDGSHPYVHAMYRDEIAPEHRRDRPAKTKAKKLADVLAEIKAAAAEVRNSENAHHLKWDTAVQNLLAIIEDAE